MYRQIRLAPYPVASVDPVTLLAAQVANEIKMVYAQILEDEVR